MQISYVQCTQATIDIGGLANFWSLNKEGGRLDIK